MNQLSEGILKLLIPSAEPTLLEEIANRGTLLTATEGQQILREGQYIKVIPLIISGLVKVFIRDEDKELLLYYIRPNESCVMSLTAGLSNLPSKVFAEAEEPSHLLLIPVDAMREWLPKYPSLNTLFYQLYDTRYTDLIETISQLIFKSLDIRLYDFLREQAQLKQRKVLPLRHREIAAALGSSREVITRLLKKLEKEGKIHQHTHGIEII